MTEASDPVPETLDRNMNSSKTEGVDLPAQVLCPHIKGPNIIENLLKEEYGLTALRLKPLNGYDDLNFHVTVDAAHSNPYIDAVSPDGYFLKVSNQQDSERPSLLYAQLAVMQHLLKNGITCQTPIKGLNGDVFTKCTAPNKDGVDVTYMVSLRTFLPGKIAADTTLTAELLYNMGQFVARVSKALEDFEHPVYEDFDCLWSMNNIPVVAKATFAVKDEKMRQISEQVIEAFRKEVVASKPGFRAGQIHGDLNEQNILVTTDSTPKICGLLDFQDTAKSFPLYDLAINICYMMMTKYYNVPLLDIPGHVLSGYTSILTLTRAERAVLRTCVAGRMVQSLVYGAYTFYLDPTNEYVLETSKCGWKALQTFWEANEEELWEKWDEIICSYKQK